MSILGAMWERIRGIGGALIQKDRVESKKVWILSAAFFVVIGGYTLVKELKDLVFMNTVGYDYLPAAKMWSIIALIPMVFFYSRLVDVLKRHQLIYLFSLLYGVGGLVFAYYLGHPTIGLPNTDTSKYRIFGWVFFFFLEGYQPFLVSLLWAFVNTVTRPGDVKNSYVVITAGSKLGGAATAGAVWLFLVSQRGHLATFSEVSSMQILMAFSGIILLICPLLIAYLMHTIPVSHLHGYEMAYKLEKVHEKKVKKQGGLFSVIKSMFSGLYLLVRYPYAFGIFGMIFFWEVVNVCFNYVRLGVGQESSNSLLDFGAFLYGQIFFMHLIGLAIVLIGTSTMVSLLGERKSLILVPLATGCVIWFYLFSGGMISVGVAYIIIRAINYAFASPLRESLYIPTTKDMKFKTKSWIDGFGAKLAKCSGSSYNLMLKHVSSSALLGVHISFFTGIIVLWTVVANLLGRRFEKAVEKNEVIGTEEVL